MSRSMSWNAHPVRRVVELISPLSIPAVIFLAFLLRSAGFDSGFEPPWPLPLLNSIFLTLIPAGIVTLTLKGYVRSGSLGFLGPSCRTFLMGVSPSCPVS